MTLVSIGLPVRNGEQQLGSAIASLLAQDEPDLELLVSDNGSTDATADIGRAAARSDERVRYERHDANHGAAWNFNHVVRSTTAPYFMWAAHDDIWHPSFVRCCIERLEGAPHAVACHTGWQPVDSTGAAMGDPRRAVEILGSVVERWARVQRDWTVHAAVYSLMRRAALERTHLFRSMNGADVLLIAELALCGEIVGIDEALIDKRVPGDDERYRTPTEMAEYLGARPGAASMLRLRLSVAEAACALRSRLPARTRARLASMTAQSYVSQGYLNIDARELGQRLLRREVQHA